MVGAALRYEHTFGAVDFKTYGLYETSGKEDLTTQEYMTPAQSRAAFANGAATGINATQFLRYNDMGFYQAGVAVTADNFTLAADYMGGQVDGQLSLNPSGGVAMNAFVVGLTYANGPWILGSMLESSIRKATRVWSASHSATRLGPRSAATTNWPPACKLVVEYQYEYRHQGGFDFSQGTLGVDGRTVDSHGQGILTGLVMNW